MPEQDACVSQRIRCIHKQPSSRNATEPARISPRMQGTTSSMAFMSQMPFSTAGPSSHHVRSHIDNIRNNESWALAAKRCSNFLDQFGGPLFEPIFGPPTYKHNSQDTKRGPFFDPKFGTLFATPVFVSACLSRLLLSVDLGSPKQPRLRQQPAPPKLDGRPCHRRTLQAPNAKTYVRLESKPSSTNLQLLNKLIPARCTQRLAR